MTRAELREEIFKLLFRIEFNSPEDMEEQCGLFFDNVDMEYEEKDAEYIHSKYDKIIDKLEEIDEAINQRTKGWDTTRMAKVDLTIIRLAVYEIRYDDEVPTGVAINEAVNLAKKFGQDQSYSFVNGVLSNFN
ncbi:MAG: transcription antitermination factor NusB [Lachnospiraceae bacterium]|jgi:N utilization substance protein B|nr:transcription antitermination factor NusB [Lachnospiraceae bacterium]